MGMPVGACGVTAELAPFLPVPTVEFDGSRYRLEYDRPQSVGKIRAFLGVPATVVRSFAWTLSLGAEGLREVAETAVLNNNYLASRVAADTGRRRLVRGHELGAAAGAGPLQPGAGCRRRPASSTLDVARRTADFGVASYFPSHEPWVVAEPMTLEPSESYSRADLDEYAEILAEVSREAYEDPGGGQVIAAAQHRPSARPGAARRPGAVGAHLAGLSAKAAWRSRGGRFVRPVLTTQLDSRPWPTRSS